MAMKKRLADSNLCVLLLGAGNSAAYGLPVMRRFMDVARRHYFTRRSLFDAEPSAAEGDLLLGNYEAMFAFYNRCRASSWAFQRDWDNIEELYTQADLLRLTHSPTKIDAEQLCTHIAWTMWDVYRRVTETFTLWKMCVQIIESGLRPVIITTNYDLLCEAAISLHGPPQEGSRPSFRTYYPGFSLPTLRGKNETLIPCEDTLEMSESVESIPIIKLHGSVNWFIFNGTKWAATTNVMGTQKPAHVGHEELGAVDAEHVENDRFLDSLLEGAMSRGVVAETDEKVEIKPAIIPPMLGKSSTSEVIAHQWRVATEAIGAARQIWVIGYSFPHTDAFMPRLLTQGMEEHLTFERFVIVDRQMEDEWELRLSSLFTPVFRQQRVRFFCQDARVAHQALGVAEMSRWETEMWNRRASHSS